MKKTILVTGCAGFVGAETVAQAIRIGYNVVGIDNMNNYYAVGLKEMRLAKLKVEFGCNFEFIKCDIEHYAQLEDIISRHAFHGVVNLAARAGVRASIADPFIYLSTNALGVLNILELMRKYSIENFVLASTSSLYAGHDLPFDENAPVNCPISPYAATKKAAEVLAYTYSIQYKINVSVLRYFTVYGPAGRPDMSPLKFCHAIANGLELPLFGDGRQSRDFTYIDDIARGTIASLGHPGYEIFNLGCGSKPVTILDMISSLEKSLKRKANILYLPTNPTDMEHTHANNEKARRLLGWKPVIEAHDGFDALARWYMDNQTQLLKIL